MEGLITGSPDNTNLRLAAARGFAAYAYLVQQTKGGGRPATTVERRTFDHRVSRLFQRGRDHAMAGLEARHPGFAEALTTDRDAALARIGPTDVELLYWAGATWAGAISADKRDLAMVATLPIAASLVIRTVELDDGFDGGAAHEFLMLYEAGRPGGTLDVAEAHYRRAVELSGGTSAGAHVGYAEMIAVARQDRAAFRRALDAALAVDTDAAPDRRLTNVLAQRKARRFLDQEDLLFIAPEGDIS
jgi:predicted anti-sigma-YlaC factor YlaD